jgi:chitinase
MGVVKVRLRVALALISALVCIDARSIFAADSGSSRVDPQHRVVAYLASWSVPPAIHPEHLTHINFAFAHIDKTGRAGFDQPAVGQSLMELQALKKVNPRLKLIVSVGGWQAEGFSDAALTGSSRTTFAQSAVTLLRDTPRTG